MPTRQKTSGSGNRRISAKKPTGAARPETILLELESQLVDLNSKLERLERKHAQKPSDQLSNLIKQYQAQVVSIEQKVATMLRDDPALAPKGRPNLGGAQGYTSEPDYREQLSRAQDKLETELINELRAEQDKREREWRQAERVKMDQREQQLLEMLAERQAKVEDEWQMRRKTDSTATAFAWFTEQQKALREQLQAGMQKLRQEFDAREQEHAEEVRQVLALLERQWSEKRRKELQKLEVDWREQELMHRERVYLRRMEGEWRAEQRLTLEQLTNTWRADLEEAQTQQIAAHLSEVLPKLLTQSAEQFTKDQDIKSRALFEKAKADWDSLLQEKLRKDMEQTIASLRKEVDQRLNNEIASLTTSHSEALKTTQRDYAALASAWEKKHADALQAQRENWQSQQNKVLTELSSEMRASMQGQLLQLKTVLESQVAQTVSNMFKQWSQQFTEEQTAKSQASLKQFKSDWDTALRETLKRDSEVLQSQHEQTLKSTQTKLKETLTAAIQRDYAELVRHWEKQHTDGLQKSKDLWQEHQQTSLAEFSGETRNAVKALEHERATLSNKWDRKFSEALVQQQELWPKEQDRLINDMSTSILKSLQSQMIKYEESSSQARSKALREMSIKLSEQVALEITQRIDTLRSEFHKDFDQYAHGWQGELDAQFTQLSNKYTKQHQQELELLGQESRGDLAKEANIAREQLKQTFGSELQDAVKELNATFAATLEQQKQTLLHQHHKQLRSLEDQWKSSTEAAIGDLLKTTATLHEQRLDKLKIALEHDYRRELQAAALVDVKERENTHQALAEKAAVTLKEHLSAALKDLESLHAKRLDRKSTRLNSSHH